MIEKETPVALTSKPEHELKLSASSMSKLKECPRKWKYSYIDFIKEGAGEAAMIGTQGHAVLEKFYALDPWDRTEETLKEIATAEWDEFHTEFSETFPETARDVLSLKQEVWKSVTGIYHFEDPKKVRVHSVELPINIKYEGIPFRGFIDRIDTNARGGVDIIDYKMGKVPAKPEYMRPKLIQVLLYAWALNSMGYNVGQASLFYARDGVKTTVDINSKTLKLAKKEMDVAVAKVRQYIADDFFPAKTSPLCAWCPHILDCEEGRAHFQYLANAGRVKPHAPAWVLFEMEEKANMFMDENGNLTSIHQW